MEQLFEAVVGVVYLGLIVVVAITGVFASKAHRRKAALEVLRVLLVRRGTSSRDDHDAGGGP